MGDEPFQRKCMEKIREFQAEGRSIILVSHSAEQIIDVCDRAIVLDHGRIIAMGDARDAMSRLHQSYEKQILQDVSDANDRGVDTAKERLCTIKDVAVTEGLIEQRDGLKVHISGDTIKVGIDVAVSAPLADYGIVLDIDTLKDVMTRLQVQEKLDSKYRDHDLIGNWKGCRECHLGPDWLLIYRIEEDTIVFIRTGSHTEVL